MKYATKVIKTKEEYESLQDFAKTFAHEVVTDSFPLIEFVKDGKRFGYAQVITSMPIVFPAYHPDLTTGRDVYEMGCRFIGWGDLQFGGGFTTVPTTGDTKFTHEIMTKLGFKRMGLELYER